MHYLYNIVLTRCILFTISSDKIFPLYNKFWQDLLSFEVNFYQDLLSFYIIDPNKCILSSNKTSNEICFLYHMFRKWFALFFRIVPTKCILSCNKVITRFTPFCSQFLSRLTLFCIKILTRCIIPYNIVLTRCILFTISSDKIFSLYNKFWQDLLSFEVNFYQDLLSFTL